MKFEFNAERELTVTEKALLWDALLNSGRIRILGYAGLGRFTDPTIPRYAHMGLEFWTEISNFGDKPEHVEANKEAAALITEYAMRMVENEQENTEGN